MAARQTWNILYVSYRVDPIRHRCTIPCLIPCLTPCGIPLRRVWYTYGVWGLCGRAHQMAAFRLVPSSRTNIRQGPRSRSRGGPQLCCLEHLGCMHGRLMVLRVHTVTCIMGSRGYLVLRHSLTHAHTCCTIQEVPALYDSHAEQDPPWHFLPALSVPPKGSALNRMKTGRASRTTLPFSPPRTPPDWRHRRPWTKHTPLGRTFAMQASTRNCSPAPDLALQKLVFPQLLFSRVRGNHLSNTTCRTQVFFKSGEECGKAWWSLTRRTTHKTSEAALDK